MRHMVAPTAVRARASGRLRPTHGRPTDGRVEGSVHALAVHQGIEPQLNRLSRSADAAGHLARRA
jgi:hypothetical protein